MILLNDFFSDEKFVEIESVQDIETTSNNSTLIFHYKDELLETFKFCSKNNISYGVYISSIKEFIFVSNLNAKYVFVTKDISKIIQNIANEYLSDTKVIVIIKNINEIEEIAKDSIDGVFFYDIILA